MTSVLKCQTLHRPPEVSYTAFTAQLPDLLPECPDEYGTSLSSANSSPRRQPHILVSVRQLAVLLHTAFSLHLAVQTLCLR